MSSAFNIIIHLLFFYLLLLLIGMTLTSSHFWNLNVNPNLTPLSSKDVWVLILILTLTTLWRNKNYIPNNVVVCISYHIISYHILLSIHLHCDCDFDCNLWFDQRSGFRIIKKCKRYRDFCFPSPSPISFTRLWYGHGHGLRIRTGDTDSHFTIHIMVVWSYVINAIFRQT
jgi:hypothetical protein